MKKKTEKQEEKQPRKRLKMSIELDEKKHLNLCANCLHFNADNFATHDLTKNAGICEKKSMIKFKHQDCNLFLSQAKVDLIFSDKPNQKKYNNIAPGTQLELF